MATLGVTRQEGGLHADVTVDLSERLDRCAQRVGQDGRPGRGDEVGLQAVFAKRAEVIRQYRCQALARIRTSLI